MKARRSLIAGLTGVILLFVGMWWSNLPEDASTVLPPEVVQNSTNAAHISSDASAALPNQPAFENSGVVAASPGTTLPSAVGAAVERMKVQWRRIERSNTTLVN